MILTDFKRRWAEIRFYYFCYDIYKIKNNLVDVIYVIEAISQIGNFKISKIKTVAGKMLSDPYYMPLENEMIMAAHKNDYPMANIATYLNKTRQYIYKVVNRDKDKFAFIPKCDIDEDEQIVKFLGLLDTLKKAGL